MFAKEQFKNRVAFITGASSGIGRATALAFAKYGARVAIGDVLEKDGEETIKMIRAVEGEATFFKCDVSKEEDVKHAILETVKQYGRLDFAFNNAGVEGTQGPTKDCTTDNFEHIININLKGVWFCLKYELDQMIKQKHGAIVNCSSIAGLVGFPGIPAYVASKHGVIGLTKNAALEYAKMNIRVNAVCPGVIQTPMIDRFTHGEAQATKVLKEGEPIGRIGKPEEIADAVVWLCSDGASFVTGHSLVVDGGWVAQ